MAIVHTFEKWNGNRMVWSKYKMTAEALARDNDLVKIAGTQEEVPDCAVDGSGKYYPGVQTRI
jgi:hypothetical protein